MKTDQFKVIKTEKTLNSLLRNTLAVIAGIIAGGLTNMLLIMVSGQIIPSPEGLDTSNAVTLQNTIHLLEPQHFIMPFLAHALGTLVGTFVGVKLSVAGELKVALVIGLFFLLGGLGNVRMIPSPAWFNALDLLVAYVPMAWLGLKLSGRKAV